MTVSDLPCGPEYHRVVEVAEKLAKNSRLSKEEKAAVLWLAKLARKVVVVYTLINHCRRHEARNILYGVIDELRKKPKGKGRVKVD